MVLGAALAVSCRYEIALGDGAVLIRRADGRQFISRNRCIFKSTLQLVSSSAREKTVVFWGVGVVSFFFPPLEETELWWRNA